MSLGWESRYFSKVEMSLSFNPTLRILYIKKSSDTPCLWSISSSTSSSPLRAARGLTSRSHGISTQASWPGHAQL